jgi:hypothetical protein
MRKLAALPAVLLCTVAMGQSRPVVTSTTTTIMDSAKTKLGASAAAKPGPKPFKEVITDKAVTDAGMFAVHKLDDKYFFEIPNQLLDRDILIVTRISKAAAGVRVGGGFEGFAGDQINENVIQFAKGPNNKIFLKNISFLETGRDSSLGMYRNVMNSNIQPIAASFDVKALSKDSLGVVIEMTDYIAGDNDILFFSNGDKRSFGLGGVQADKSYAVGVKSYPENSEIRTVKTYSKTGGGGIPGLPAQFAPTPPSTPATFEINTSMVLLPATPMKPRYFDDRVGFFTTQTITDFDANPQGIERFRMAARYRLEPKAEDVERYKRGELVEPKKQIVYYIDATTPKKWIPYLIQGVDDWQIAFEKAGFKNAIVGKLAPTFAEDSTFSLEDARHSAIVYKPSEVPNASGPNVHDPRSGEIIEAHVNWYHNVMSLVRNWYMTQAGATDPKARQMLFDDSTMGQLIRFVSSHEVGHTIGLRHNFGSSSTTPVEKLRDRKWVEENHPAHTIMDYARFNYVAQPEDNMSQAGLGLGSRIGAYDKWAIEWGYRYFPDTKTADDDVPVLNKLTSEKLKDRTLWWGDGEGNRGDPRSQSEDLGDNSMKASSYGVKNLQRILPQLPTWTKMPNKDFSGLSEIYSNVTGQFGRYIGHVATNVGGIYRTPKKVEQAGPVYEYTPKATQKEAMLWLQEQVFKTPTWVVNRGISQLTNSNPQSVILNLQNAALNRLISANTAGNLQRFEADEPGNAYTLTEMMNDLRKGIFTELVTKKPIDIYRRQLQKSFTEKVMAIVSPPSGASGNIVITLGGGGASAAPDPSTSDLLSTAKAQLRTLQAEIRAAIPTVPDAASKNHLADLSDRISKALNPK